ncbi:MAG: hypothetical protein ACFE95_18975 [Candidatus Hodarchaeota archaeon]
MSERKDYTAWFGHELKKLIDLITERAVQENQEIVRGQIAEIQRGVEYGTNNPGSIDELLLKLGRSLVDSLQVYIRQMQPRTPSGIPPGGQPTILTGGGAVEPSNSTHSSESYSVDELKGALASRKKKAVETKMKGSLDLLKEYED